MCHSEGTGQRCGSSSGANSEGSGKTANQPSLVAYVVITLFTWTGPNVDIDTSEIIPNKMEMDIKLSHLNDAHRSVEKIKVAITKIVERFNSNNTVSCVTRK